MAEGIGADSSAATVRRILAAQQRQPWRPHVWLSPQQARDAACSATGAELIDLSPRPLRPEAIVLAVDEQTSLQPRPRRAPTLPAQPQTIPTRHAHEYQRAGALHRWAAFDPRSGPVDGHGSARKRQRAFITGLAALEAEIDEAIRLSHLVCDTGSPHHGHEVQKG